MSTTWKPGTSLTAAQRQFYEEMIEATKEAFKELRAENPNLKLPGVLEVAAVASLESNYGQSGLATGSQNYFGLKDNEQWTGGTSGNRSTKENSGTITIQANFKSFQDKKDAVRGFVEHLATRAPGGGDLIYSKVFDPSNNVPLIESITLAGYHTDARYIGNANGRLAALTASLDPSVVSSLTAFDASMVPEGGVKPLDAATARTIAAKGDITLDPNAFVRKKDYGDALLASIPPVIDPSLRESDPAAYNAAQAKRQQDIDSWATSVLADMGPAEALATLIFMMIYAAATGQDIGDISNFFDAFDRQLGGGTSFGAYRDSFRAGGNATIENPLSAEEIQAEIESWSREGSEGTQVQNYSPQALSAMMDVIASKYKDTQTTDRPALVIDWGHITAGAPGIQGAVGTSGVSEAEVTIRMIERYAEQMAEKGFAVYFTHTDPGVRASSNGNKSDIGARERYLEKIIDAKHGGNGIFVSFHANAYNSSSNGLETLAIRGSKGETLAAMYHQNLREAGITAEGLEPDGAMRDRGIKDIRVGVLTDGGANKHARILLEPGFLRNAHDEALLRDPEFLDRMTTVLGASTVQYAQQMNMGLQPEKEVMVAEEKEPVSPTALAAVESNEVAAGTTPPKTETSLGG